MAWIGCGGAAPGWVESPENHETVLPLVVAVHGYGDRPESLRALVERCELPVRVVAPRGPIPVGGDPSDPGYSWFDIASGPGGVRYEPEAIGRAADRLAEVIEEAKRTRPHGGDVVITGFSQGGILSFAVALRHPELVGTAIPLAGALPDILVPDRLPQGIPPIHALHGERDRVIPVAPARALIDRLAREGRTADLTVFPEAAHAVTPAMHAAFCRTLSAAISRER